MVQLDPAQKQAPVAAEVFNERRMMLQAKQEVNLLLEKSKSVVSTEKGKLDNLQVISSFTVLAKPGFEKETYEIYRQEVRKVNEQLIMNKENFDIQLEETKPGKLYIVCGRYEEREPKVAPEQNENVQQAARISPILSNATVDVAAATGEKEKTSQPNFTAKEKKAIKISPETLADLGPLALTVAQWGVMKERILVAAGGGFSGISEAQKIEAIRQVVSYQEYEGKGGLQYPTPNELKGREVRKAAGTLSDRMGDCDDYSLLFIACVKRLEAEGLLKVEGMKLAIMEYYDPKDMSVKAHANVLQITISEEKTLENTAVLVDLTNHTKSWDLKLESKNAVGENADLRKMMLEHLNENRKPAEMIKPEYFQMVAYGGSAVEGHKYDGVEFYYKEKKGETNLVMRITEAEGHAEKAMELMVKGDFKAAQPEHEEATRQFNAIINELTAPKGAIELGESSGGYHADLLSRLAELYRQEYLNLSRESHTLSQLYPGKTEISGDKSAKSDEVRGEWLKLHQQLMANVDGLNAFALSYAASHEFNRGTEHYARAEELAEKAIQAAPFRIDGYEAKLDIFVWEKRKDDALRAFDEFDKNLSGINSDNTGNIYDVRVKLKEHFENEMKKAGL